MFLFGQAETLIKGALLQIRAFVARHCALEELAMEPLVGMVVWPLTLIGIAVVVRAARTPLPARTGPKLIMRIGRAGNERLRHSGCAQRGTGDR